MENLTRLFQKKKQQQQHMKRLNFITQFKNEFLLMCTHCRDVLVKMPDIEIRKIFFSVKHLNGIFAYTRNEKET